MPPELSPPDPAALAAWPGRDRRAPRITQPDYLHLRELVRSIEAVVATELAGRRELHALDLACGSKPYYPLFATVTSRYVGIDREPGLSADCLASVEAIPFRDGSFDLVVCTQAIGYAESPVAALREAARILRPGGLALVTMHGTFANTGDHWRVTLSGAPRLLAQAGLVDVRVVPNGNALLSLCQLGVLYLDAFTGYGRRIPRRVAAVGFAAANAASLLLHRLDRSRGEKFSSMNYTITGRKP